MTTEMIFKLLALTCFILIGVFQIRNFYKYRMTNGANFTRGCLFLINLLMGIHQVRLLFTDEHAYYFAAMAGVWFVMQFQDWIYPVLAKIRNIFK